MILILFLVSGCGEGKFWKQPVAVLDFAFVRSGVVLELNRSVTVKQGAINGQPVKLQVLGANPARRVLLLFDWKPGEKYQLSLEMDNSTSWSLSTIAPQKPLANLLASINLEKVKPARITSYNRSAYERIAISPSGDYVAAASCDRQIYLFTASTGKCCWKYHIPAGRGSAVAFSKDSRVLLAGEASPDGYLYALDRDNGQLLWQFRAADVVGSARSAYWGDFTHISSIVVTNKGYAYVGMERREKQLKQGKSQYNYFSYIYCLEVNSGRTVWRYPAKEPMDAGLSQLRITPNGEFLVFANTSWSFGKSYREGTLRCLDGSQGNILWEYTPPCLPQFNAVNVWEGIAISASGKYAALFTGDGRGYLFDNYQIIKTGSVAPLWHKDIGTPLEVSGIPIYAHGSELQLTEQQVIFVTGATFVSPGSKGITKTPPIKHPNQTAIMAYNPGGALLWRWELKGLPAGSALSANGRYLIASVSHNILTHNVGVHGIYCFDLQKEGDAVEKLDWFYKTAGIEVTAAIADNGSVVTGIEVPITLENEFETIGKHTVHVIQ